MRTLLCPQLPGTFQPGRINKLKILGTSNGSNLSMLWSPRTKASSDFLVWCCLLEWGAHHHQRSPACVLPDSEGTHCGYATPVLLNSPMANPPPPQPGMTVGIAFLMGTDDHTGFWWPWHKTVCTEDLATHKHGVKLCRILAWRCVGLCSARGSLNQWSKQ